MSRKQESGQVFVLAALSMMVLVGISAFCVNASYMFYQHQRMQAQVDEQTRLAAGSGCTAGTSTVDSGKLVITPVAPLGFFGQEGSYCDGVLTKSPGGLFGNILRFPNQISVHAVAEHGGSTEPYFALLGLSTSGDSHGCSIYFQDASEVVNITGDSYSDSSMNAATCKDVAPPLGKITYTDGSYNYSSNVRDPFHQNVLVSGTLVSSPVTAPAGGYSDTCGNSVPSGDKYYQPTSKNEVVEISDVSTSNTTFHFLPYCSGTTQYAGTYLIDNKIKLSSSGVIDSVNSTFVLSTTAVVQMSGGTINWNESLNGAYTGYVLYENATLPCSSTQSIGFNGGGTQVINGLIDTECGDISFSGGATYDINGTVVGNTITFAGSTTGQAVIKAPPVPPARGAFLVQ